MRRIPVFNAYVDFKKNAGLFALIQENGEPVEWCVVGYSTPASQPCGYFRCEAIVGIRYSPGPIPGLVETAFMHVQTALEPFCSRVLDALLPMEHSSINVITVERFRFAIAVLPSSL